MEEHRMPPPQPQKSHAQSEAEQRVPEERPGVEEQTRARRESLDDDREGQEMRRDTPFKKEWDEQTPKRGMNTSDNGSPENQDSDAPGRKEVSTTGAEGVKDEGLEGRSEGSTEGAYAHQPGEMTTRVISESEGDQLRTRERELESIGIEEAQGSRIDELAWLEKSRKEQERSSSQGAAPRGRGSMSLEEAGHRGGEAVKKKYGHKFYSDIGRKGGQAAQAQRSPQERSDIGRKGGQSRGKQKPAKDNGIDRSKEPTP
jgi:general stress protein YciG